MMTAWRTDYQKLQGQCMGLLEKAVGDKKTYNNHDDADD
jgi:hypothetical protein